MVLAKNDEAAAPDPAPLVELTVYGVACLYERYPARPKAVQPKDNTPAKR